MLARLNSSARRGCGQCLNSSARRGRDTGPLGSYVVRQRRSEAQRTRGHRARGQYPGIQGIGTLSRQGQTTAPGGTGCTRHGLALCLGCWGYGLRARCCALRVRSGAGPRGDRLSRRGLAAPWPQQPRRRAKPRPGLLESRIPICWNPESHTPGAWGEGGGCRRAVWNPYYMGAFETFWGKGSRAQKCHGRGRPRWDLGGRPGRVPAWATGTRSRGLAASNCPA
jgi:hypothetical protein